MDHLVYCWWTVPSASQPIDPIEKGNKQNTGLWGYIEDYPNKPISIMEGQPRFVLNTAPLKKTTKLTKIFMRYSQLYLADSAVSF